MSFQTVFKRYELKYMLTPLQKEMILEAMLPYMELDKYGRTTIRNIYFDTDNYRLIRRSIEKPVKKEVFFMSVKSFLCAVAAVAAVLAVSGATVEFRSGTLLAAELSNIKPDVKLENENTANRIFARMVIKLAPERKISICDYELSAYGRNFKAIAISENNGKWLTDDTVLENIDGKTKVSILFEVDGSVIGKQNIEVFEVVTPADRQAKPDVVKFKNIGKNKFSPVSGIKESGRMVK